MFMWPGDRELVIGAPFHKQSTGSSKEKFTLDRRPKKIRKILSRRYRKRIIRDTKRRMEEDGVPTNFIADKVVHN